MSNTSNPTNNDFVVKVSLDVDSNSITGLQTKINGIPTTPIPVRLDITNAQNQINTLRNQIQALNNIQVNIGGNGGGGGRQRNRGINDVTRAYQELISLQSRISSKELALDKLDTSRNQREIIELTNQINNLYQRYRGLYDLFSGQFDNNQLDRLNRNFDISNEKIELLNRKLRDTRASLAQGIILNFNDGAIDKEVSKINSDLSKINTQSNQVTASLQQFDIALNNLGVAINSGDIERIIIANEKYKQALKEAENQIAINIRAEKELNKNIAFEDSKINALNKVKEYLKENTFAAKKNKDAFDNLILRIEQCNDKDALKHLKSEFEQLTSKIKQTGNASQSFFDKFSAQVSKLGVYYSASTIFMHGTQAIREMYDNVLLIDTAMTELIKVTNETDEVYNRFLDNVGDKAKKIGTTIDGFISSTADFARLGYSFDKAQELAEVANIYAVVGDEIDGVEQATESLISTLAAFEDEVDAMEIIDKFNEIGNNFSISSGGIGEALRRSASSLKAANNTLDESIALITAANTVVQDPETVGTAFKTVSMRIRGAKSELEEAGLETEGMAESTAKMREEIMALTGVDIMLDANTFKGTYQILDEIADKWEELTDIQQASVTELIAGKRQGNIISSLMQNFDTARDALEMSMDSEGSALEEHAKWQESLEAHVKNLTVAWQNLSQTVLDSDFLKVMIDGLTSIVNLLDWIISNIGIIGTIALGGSLFSIFKNGNGESKVFTNLFSSLVKGKVGLDDFGKAAKEASSNFGKFASVSKFGAVATGIGLVVTAVSAAISIYDNYREKQSQLRQETLKTNNEILDSIDSLEQAYVKYSGKTKLTSKEESELKSVIDGTVDVLGDKAGAIQGVIDKNYSYIKSLEDVSKAELIQAKKIADDNLIASGDELKGNVRNLKTGTHNVEIHLDKNAKDEEADAVKLAQEYLSEYIEDKGFTVTESIAKLSGSEIENTDVIIDYYYKVLDFQNELYEKDLNHTQVYKDTIKVTDALKKSVEEYNIQKYNSLKYEYELANGIPKTVEEYQAMKKWILENVKASQEYKNEIADIADTEWGNIFGKDLDKYYADLDKRTKLKQSYKSNDGLQEEFSKWVNSLSSEDLSIVYSIMVDNSNEARQNIKTQLEELSDGGNVDLVLRPVVDTKELINAGWEDVGEGSATVFTSTFANKAGELGKKDGIAINFTPIMVDENGNYIGTLSPEELEQYAFDVMSGVRKDDLNLQIGATYTGTDAIAKAEADAVRIHDLHEKYLLTPSIDDWNLTDWQNAFANYEIPESAKYSFSDLMKDEGFVGKVDTHIEKVDKLKDALDKLKDGSFDIDGEDFVELVKEFPELADNADNLEEALKQSIEDINLGTFEELISYLEYMDSDVDYTSLQNFISALTDAEVEMHNVLDFTDFLDNLNNVVDSFDNLVSAMSKLRDGTALTKGEIVDLISEYPKLLTEANLFTDGSISGQQKMLDNILQVYEAEYNALIDTKIAELKASNEVLNAALENEKAKAQKVIEISALEVEGKVLNESELVRKLQEFNDLEGQNYVEYSNGVLSVNKEMLDDMLVQEGEKKDLAETNVWKPQAVDIAESYASGASDALQSLNTFGTRLGTWAKNTINNTFKPLKKAFSAIFNNEEEITEDAGSSTVDVDIKAGLSIEADGKATIDGQSIDDWSAKQQDILEQRIKDIQDSLKKNNIAIENLENLKGLDLVDIYGGDGSGSGSGSSSKSSQTFNWIETAIERVQRALSNLDRTANSVYKSWGTRNDALSKQIKKARKEIDLQNKAAEYYKQKANSIGLDDKWKQKVEKGLIEGTLDEVISDIDTSTDSGKALADKISQYQEWYSKILECEDAVLELKESESDLYKQSFDNVMSQYESVLSIIEHEKSMIDSYISQSEAKGHIVSTKYYESLMKHEENNIAKLQEERDALIASLEDGMANGGIEKYSEQWFDMVNSIDETTLAIEEGKLALLEYGNAIQEIEWSIFDMLQEQISQVTDEANFLIDLMSNDKLYDDNGRLTDSGMATMGMHGMNYNTYMHQADLYAEKILEIEKELAEDPYNQTLIDKKQEYIEAQRDSILAAEDEKQAIVDLVREGIELELDALNELIDAKKEELDAEKSLHDYQKKTAKQVKDIANLRKQLAAYENDNSEEVKAKIQELRVSLTEAEEELAESEYERYIQDQEKLLDELYNDYETILNQRLDNIDALIEDVISDINTNASEINDTISEKADSVGYTLSQTMIDTWSTSTGNITSVLTTYGSNIWGSINSSTTTLSSALNTINTNIGNMVIALNGYVSSMNTSHAGSYDDIPISNPSKPTVKEEKESVKDTNNNQNKNDGNKKDNDNKKEESNKSNSISKGDTVSVSSSAKIYDYAGDTSGERQYYRNDPTYVVLNEKNGYVQVRHSSLGSGVTGWFKKSDIKGYATGKRNFLSDEIAWTQENGREFIIRPSDGAILTPLAKGDSVLNNMASNNIWDMANNPTDFIKDNLKLDIADTPINNGGLTNMTQNLENVVFQFPAVKNYEEMLNAMKSDRNFERLIMSMTVDQIAGKSLLAKGKSIR